MKYTGVKIAIDPISPGKDIVVARLGEIGYDSFADIDNGVEAFIPTDDFNEELTESVLRQNAEDWKTTFIVEDYPDQNWNAKWESAFDPIEVDDFVRIRADFHKTKSGFNYEIVITPQMSFGTGHHQTTRGVMRAMKALNLEGKSLLDMGCGTGILAILAEKLGASDLTAIDIDEWSVSNTKDNLLLNGSPKVDVLLGGKEVIPERNFDFIVANINRNILQDQLPEYARRQPHGQLILSGFFSSDISTLQAQSDRLGYRLKNTFNIEGWAVMMLEK